jgi:hypothetical protein
MKCDVAAQEKRAGDIVARGKVDCAAACLVARFDGRLYGLCIKDLAVSDGAVIEYIEKAGMIL